MGPQCGRGPRIFGCNVCPCKDWGGRHLNKSSSGEHQCLLEAAFKTTSPPVRITLNFECPEPERIEEWARPFAQSGFDLGSGPCPSVAVASSWVARLVAGFKPPSQWFGWTVQRASAQDAWLEQLGMPPPSADVLLVLGALGPGWESGLGGRR